LDYAETTDEIKELCKDLLVLSKGDFGNLLRWRTKIKEIRNSLKKKDAEESSEEENESDGILTDGERDEKLSKELKKLKKKMLKQKKKMQKREKERK